MLKIITPLWSCLGTNTHPTTESGMLAFSDTLGRYGIVDCRHGSQYLLQLIFEATHFGISFRSGFWP
jgi:hypothetical protein